MTSKEELAVKKKKGHLGLSNSFHYTLMVLPGYIWLFMFSIVPMVGIVMAFQDYNPSKGWFGSPWVGLKWFKYLTVIPDAKRALVNTLIIAIAKVILNIIIPLVFALLLNEVKNMKFKKTVQTIVYLPHFVSWVVIASIAKMVLNDGGMLDTLARKNLKLMSTNSVLFWIVVCFINVWKEVGWDAIVYLSAMAGIDQGLYEAAKVDGANRLQRIWHITLPGIKPTVVVLLIMGIGGALNVGMERQMLLSNGIVQDHAMVLSWFAYIRGIGNNNYGLGTAIGMFQSLVGIALLFIANKIAGWLGESRLI